MRRRHLLLGSAATTIAAAAGGLALTGRRAPAQEATLNLYSARHYDSDRLLYDLFTRESGIRVRLIEGDADQLIERIRSEGANSPADVLITVDAARLWRAKQAGILAPVRSGVLEARVPEAFRDPEAEWFAVAMRARVVMYDKSRGRPEGLSRYEDLARPRWADTICVRSSSHPYNVSLMASIMAGGTGVAAAEAWARGVVANMARPPQGGDVPQIRAVAAGQCRFAIANTYYLARMAASSDPAERAVADKVGVIFPNQGDRGAHVNISGAGMVRTAPHKQAAQRFLEFLVSDEAQRRFAGASFEYPIVESVPPHPALAALGRFRADSLNAALYGQNSAEALRLMQRAGWR